MSRENVDAVREVLEAWNQRDPDLGRRYLAADAEWEPASPAAVESAVHRGIDEIAGAAAALWDIWDEFRFDATEIRDLGSTVVWLGQVHVRGSSSEVEFDQEFGIHFSLSDGKIRRAKSFLSHREALEAVGLRE